MKKKLLAYAIPMLVFSAAAFAMFRLSVSVSGCISSGTGEFECASAVFGGSGSYNYWWTYSGPGQLYQTNSEYVSISGCLDGEGSLTVQVLDRDTGQTALSAPFTVICDCSPLNSEACEIDIFPEPCSPSEEFPYC